SFLLICTVLRIFENVSGEWVRSRPNFRGWRPMGPLKLSSERETTPNPPLRQAENPRKSAGFKGKVGLAQPQVAQAQRLTRTPGEVRVSSPKQGLGAPDVLMGGDAGAFPVIGGNRGCRLLLSDDRGRQTL